MTSADLRHRITLIAPGPAGKDADGYRASTPGPSFTVWAARENLHGTEGMEAARATGKLTARFTIRYLAGLDNHWKLRADCLDFNILYVDDIKGMHQWIEILAEAVT